MPKKIIAANKKFDWHNLINKNIEYHAAKFDNLVELVKLSPPTKPEIGGNVLISTNGIETIWLRIDDDIWNLSGSEPYSWNSATWEKLCNMDDNFRPCRLTKDCS